MEKTQMGSHGAGIDPHVSQEGALARIGLVTGGTSLEWPYNTLLVVSSVIGLNDESVANVWKELHTQQSNVLKLMMGIWEIIGRGKN